MSSRLIEKGTSTTVNVTAGPTGMLMNVVGSLTGATPPTQLAGVVHAKLGPAPLQSTAEAGSGRAESVMSASRRARAGSARIESEIISPPCVVVAMEGAATRSVSRLWAH